MLTTVTDDPSLTIITDDPSLSIVNNLFRQNTFFVITLRYISDSFSFFKRVFFLIKTMSRLLVLVRRYINEVGRFEVDYHLRSLTSTICLRPLLTTNDRY